MSQGDDPLLPADAPTSPPGPVRDDDSDTHPMPTHAHSVPLRDELEDEGEIARGGMGAIHRVRDHAIGRALAMKVLRPEKMSELHERRFLEEARITGQLEHPNIVPVYELALRPDRSPHYFTMKLVEGDTLSKMIGAHILHAPGAPDLHQLLQVFLRVCDAVAYAHDRGVIHRDLKPANIMVGPYGQVYVMDWGLGLVYRPEDPSSVAIGVDRKGNREARGSVSGTFAYMAPEQALGMTDKIDPRTDIFALGAILYKILTGMAPYRGTEAMPTRLLAQQGVIESPSTRNPARDIPPELERIVMKALQPRRADRYASVADMAKEIERATRGGLWLPTRHFSAGELIVSQGDPAETAYVIREGICEAFKRDGATDLHVRRMGPGEVFGEMAMLTGEPRTASVRAVTDVALTILDRKAVDREMLGNPWMAAFMQALADRFRDVDARLTKLQRSQP